MIKITSPKSWFLSALVLTSLLNTVPVWAGEEGVVENRKVTVTGSIVNVRTGPDINFDKAGQVKEGEPLSVREEKDGWFLVNIPNIGQAWIAGWLAKDNTDSVQIDSESALSNPVLEQGSLVVASEIVNVRSGPGEEYDLITQAAINQKYDILAQQGGWYKIQIGQQQGWVAGWLVRIEVPAVPITSKMVTVSSNVVNFRQGASLDAAIIGKVYRGQHMSVIGQQGDWYEVKAPGGKQGWIATWLTQPLNNNPLRPVVILIKLKYRAA